MQVYNEKKRFFLNSANESFLHSETIRSPHFSSDLHDQIGLMRQIYLGVYHYYDMVKEHTITNKFVLAT